MSHAASRRAFLQSLGSLGTFAVIGCGTTNSSLTNGNPGPISNGGNDGGSSAGGDGGNAPVEDSGGPIVTASGLAVGSGAFLVGKNYGDPFAGGIGAACTAYRSATAGPCHSNTYDRKDISDGLIGLPTRFELLIVDGSCHPVPSAIVEVWYASPGGAYSKAAAAIDSGAYHGSLSDLNVGFCTGNDADALASSWLRGFQTTDSMGRVTIDGIFPGWYPGRTTHVHFIVTANGHTTITSQLAFDETLTTAVYNKHGSYSARGDKDTTNARDGVFSSPTAAEAMMSFAQQSDGALVCWKAITLV